MTLVPANSRGSNAVSSVFGRTGAVAANTGDYNGVVASALTGAVAATRYVGGTASGAPVSGTFAVGDFVVEQTGKVFVCTVAGTPGTWVQVGGGGGGFAIGSSYLRARAIGAVNLPQNATTVGTGWTLEASAGTDIAIDGGDATKVAFATAGWYQITTYTNLTMADNTSTDAYVDLNFYTALNVILESLSNDMAVDTANDQAWSTVITSPVYQFGVGDYFKEGTAVLSAAGLSTYNLNGGANSLLQVVRFS